MTTLTTTRSYTWDEIWGNWNVDPQFMTPSQKRMRVKFLWLEYINQFDQYHNPEQDQVFNQKALELFMMSYKIPSEELAKRIISVGYRQVMQDWKQYRKEA